MTIQCKMYIYYSTVLKGSNNTHFTMKHFYSMQAFYISFQMLFKKLPADISDKSSDLALSSQYFYDMLSL